MDPRLEDDYDMIEIQRAMSAAAACIHHLPNLRPNMKQVTIFSIRYGFGASIHSGGWLII